MNTPPSVSNIQELVMEICSDLFHTGRMVTRDRLHSAIDIVEMLFEKKLTYSGTINKNRKGLLTEIKTVKERENESSVFFWKKDSLFMLVSYVPTPGKNMLLISTGHEDPDICAELHKKINRF